MNRNKIISFINEYLDGTRIKDAALNGLQVEGRPEIKKIAFGVSASLECISRATDSKADLLIVHHGLFWGKPEKITGSIRKKMKLLLENDLNLAAWHLPLDKHPVTGNNAQILKLLGAGSPGPFGIYDGSAIGFKGTFAKHKTAEEIIKILNRTLACQSRAFLFGPEKIKTIGVVSGGAHSIFSQAIEAGLDLYLTGEAGEPSQEAAREAGVSFIAGGHYNTEKPGVLALAKLIQKKFRLPVEFIDIPNPV